PPNPALSPVQEPPPSTACGRAEADAVVYAALDARGRVVCQLCRSEDLVHLATSGLAQRFDQWRRTIFALEAGAENLSVTPLFGLRSFSGQVDVPSTN
ncbi:MAG: hypothetical protein GY772_13755, partial [bacterium]|nr:hypothetical protein [bacterium]